MDSTNQQGCLSESSWKKGVVEPSTYTNLQQVANKVINYIEYTETARLNVYTEGKIRVGGCPLSQKNYNTYYSVNNKWVFFVLACSEQVEVGEISRKKSKMK